jgi:hypothetical protein
MNTQIARFKTIVFVLLVGVLASCETSKLIPPLAKELEKEGWTYVTVPSELFGPGSIVSLNEHQGLRYRGRIEDCVDKDAIKYIEGGTVLKGKFSDQTNLSVAAFIGYHAIKTGPEFTKVKSVELTLGGTTIHALDEVVLSKWLDVNGGRLDRTCKAYLFGADERERETVAPEIVIILQTLRTTGYKYTFNDEKGFKIGLEPTAINDFLTIGGDVNYGVTSEGDLEVDSPLYIAFKEGFIKPGGGGWGAEAGTSDPVETQMRRNELLGR